MELTERQNKILRFIIKEYARYGEPIGSLELKEKCLPNLSPATLRNELALLEEGGYLYQPHTSSGRAPTDWAYRWFVNSSMENKKKLDRQSNQWLGKIERIKEREMEGPVNLLANFCEGLGIILDADGATRKHGLKNLFRGLQELDFDDLEKIIEDVEALDFRLENFFEELEEMERVVFIGKESPFTESENISILSRFVPGHKKKIFLLVGPKAMPYDRNLAILEAIAQYDF